jgi:hypothetical protein
VVAQLAMASVVDDFEVFSIVVVQELQDLEVKCCMTIHIGNFPFLNLKPILPKMISLLFSTFQSLEKYQVDKHIA